MAIGLDNLIFSKTLYIFKPWTDSWWQNILWITHLIQLTQIKINRKTGF